MKLLEKSAMFKAMSVALLASGMIASHQAVALPDAGATAGADASPLTRVGPNNMGQALIYPYYTVRNNFRTTMNVFNTSDTHAIAVKVRFREYQNSRDVLDFNLVLSPNDKWSANITETASGTASKGGAKLTTGDSSCTVPAIPPTGAAFSRDGYWFENDTYNFKDTGDQGFDRLKQGYIEIIPMAWADRSSNNAIFAGALHNAAGVPADCDAVVEAFAPTATAWVNGTSNPGDGAPAISSDPDWVAIPPGQNPLFGELALIDITDGLAGGTNAIAIADFMQTTVVNDVVTGVKLTTAQGFPYYLEPTLAGADGIWTTSNLPEVEAALTSATIINEWANNPGNGANVDWVVTFPTKSFRVDQQPTNIQAGHSNYRGNNLTTAPFEHTFANTRSEVTLVTKSYDSEEGEPNGTVETGDVSFSPGSFATENNTTTLKYEANTITFGGNSVLGSENPLALDPANDIAGDRVSGHMRIGVPGANDEGLPMVGFAFKERDTGNNALSFGQIFDHKYMNAE